MRGKTRNRWGRLVAAVGVVGAVGAATGPGCGPSEGCLGGDDGVCLPPSPCQALSFTCDDPSLELRVVRGAVDRPPGLDASAARGDVLLGNGRLLAVIDAIGEPQQLATSGGTLIDLVPRDASRGTGNDELVQALQTTGILPRDQATYYRLELLDQSPELVAVVARGALDGRPDVDIVTRYEVRPCEPGIRIRTELYHGGRDPETLFLADGFWWGNREVTPFVPLPGQGFVQPELDLLELDAVMFDTPFMVAQGHAPGAAAYGALRCDEPSNEAFQSVVLSAMGRERTLLMPGDAIAYERFIAVAHGPGLSEVADECRGVRAQLFAEPSVRVSGRVTSSAGEPIGGDERLASLLFYEPAWGGDPDAAERRTPQSQAVPQADGTFSVLLPPDRDYRVELHSLGRPLGEHLAFTLGTTDVVLDEWVVERRGGLDVQVTDSAGEPAIAELVLVPAGDTEPATVHGTLHGVFDVAECSPYLGAPHSAFPACNRALTEPDGVASFVAPAGTFWLYATRGPYATLARELVTVVDGERTAVSLQVDTLPDLVPDGVLSADFHVHSGASFDSSLPQRDRALSFIATGVDVVAATDHDVVTSYATVLGELGIDDRIVVLPGVETTGEVLFFEPPGATLPKVIGHHNFWPVRYDPDAPRGGVPWDERAEPGTLFDRMSGCCDGPGIIQLNHPYAEALFGRDEGYWAAIGYDPRMALPPYDDGTVAGQLVRRPSGGHRNIDYDVQEVMNGRSTKSYATFRAGWHSVLSQGYLRAGTANSDAHSAAVEVLGYPRNLVFAAQQLATFDQPSFISAVRAGRMVGTNGPVLLACVTGADGLCHQPSLHPLEPATAAQLELEVRAAPWIPVTEVRIIVNGRLARQVSSGISAPADPFGSEGLVRYQASLPLDELLAAAGASGDAWIVVEAGLPIWPAADVDLDGLVDTTDNDGNGVIDIRDQDGIDDAEDYYQEPAAPEPDDPRFHLHVVAPFTRPTAFTNPLLVDRTGDGWTAPGLP